MTAAARSYTYAALFCALLLLFFGTLLALSVSGHFFYLKVIGIYGFGEPDTPFLDLANIPAAVRCHAAGFDVLQTNPCDPLGRTLSYSPLWLDVVPDVLSPQYLWVIGITLDLLFIITIAFACRPSYPTDLAILLAAGLSTSVVFALQRGNVDLVIFIFLTLATALWGGAALSRVFAYILFLVMGLLKYYPLVLIVTVARERIATALLALTVFVAALAVFVCYYGSAVLVTLQHIAQPSYFFGDAFGIQNVPGVVTTFLALGGVTPQVASTIAFACVIILYLGTVTVVLRHLSVAGPVINWDCFDARLSIVGSTLIGGCFILGQNVNYRAIFLLMVLPTMLTLRRNPKNQPLRTVIAITIGTVLGVMWCESPRYNVNALLGSHPTAMIVMLAVLLWLVREVIWWWVVSVLIAWIIWFALQAPLLRRISWLLPGATEL
jgi:hypothetical protein